LKIKETIVVEGKSDETAVKNAIDAEFIITSGFGIKLSTFRKISWANERTGVIIFTDPDWAGERIRERINSKIPGCKNAYLIQSKAMKKGNIGVENASPDDILEALLNAKAVQIDGTLLYTMEDLIMTGLSGMESSAIMREKVGDILKIGYCNSKRFLKRLNHYSISREVFFDAVMQSSCV